MDAARSALFQARTAVHGFQASAVAQVADNGLKSAAKANKAALEAVGEFQTRRVGLGVATLLITFLVVALYLKLRDMEASP